MGRVGRPMKRVVNTGQRGFGFSTAPVEPKEPAALSDDRFLDDDPYSICFGDQRLDEYLSAAGLRWVVAMRKILLALNYELLSASYSDRGRRAFHPRTILGLMIYGLFVRCSSLRDLERLSTTDLGAMWICGGRRIDHSTIGNFVLRHEAALGKEFFASVAAWVIHQLGVRAGVSSIDGTVIESAASHWAAIKAEAVKQQALEARSAAAAEPDNGELQAAAERAEQLATIAEQRCQKRQQAAKSTEGVTVVPSDPEAVMQPRKDGPQRPAYKPCTLMHESGVIIGQHLEPSSESAAVMPLLEQHRLILGEDPKTLLMDAGLHSGPLLADLVERDLNVLCPSGRAMRDDDWQKKGNNGRFSKSAFRYDVEADQYQCPAGQWLRFSDGGKDGAGRQYRRYRTGACSRCELRAQCTTGERRSIKRYAAEEYKEAMAMVMAHPGARKVYRRRMLIAEAVHAEFRERFGLRRFHRRGLAAVRAEFGLYCIAFNIKKVLSRAAFLVRRVVWAIWRPTTAYNINSAAGAVDGLCSA
jgi:hypothetical protein